MERKTITKAESIELHHLIPNRTNSIVKLHMEWKENDPNRVMHNRECLDDVIADLQMWRDSLPSAQELMDQGVL